MSMYFRYIVIISPWKGAGSFISKNLNSLHQRMLCAKWFWSKRCLNFVNVFSLFRNYLPLEKSGALHLKKNIESLSPKNALCQVCLKLSQWFWRRRFFKFVNVFSLFRNNLPLEKSGALHLKKKQWIPFTQECFVPSLVEIGQMVLEKKIFWICQCIFAISLSPLGNRRGPSFEKREFSLPKDALCQVWLKLPSGSGEEECLNLSMYFRYY